MNENNVRYAIEVMKSAKNLYMGDFQCGDYAEVDTVEGLHACGNTACFIGYMCLTDVWKEFFHGLVEYGEVSDFSISGDVYYNDGYNFKTEYSLAKFLDISPNLADAFIYGSSAKHPFMYYPIDFEDVKPEHVIARLEKVLSGELS